jgi:hypothetical protein
MEKRATDKQPVTLAPRHGVEPPIPNNPASPWSGDSGETYAASSGR